MDCVCLSIESENNNMQQNVYRILNLYIIKEKPSSYLFHEKVVKGDLKFHNKLRQEVKAVCS